MRWRRETLAAIAAEKRAQQSPAEIVKNLLSQMRLPAAITLQRAPETTIAGRANPVNGSAVNTAAAGFPPPKASASADGADLQGQPVDLADEQAKTKTLTKERDEAVRVAQGGSVLSRIARASKWLLIGATAGAAAARAAR